MTRPNRRRVDALLEPDMRAVEAACHSAIAPLDRLANKMDQKWGVDRLVTLVSPDTAKRYGSALGRLNDAIRASDPDQCAHMAKVCMRGLAAMNEEAEQAGQEPPTLLAEYKDGPHHFGIMAENADWKPIKAARPELTLYSLREVCQALKLFADSPPIQSVKDTFPGAEIGTPRPVEPLPKDFWKNGGDEIPI